MAGVNVNELEAREELPDEGDGLVRHISALCAADEQGGLDEAGLARVLEGEVAQVVECLGQRAQRHTELLESIVVAC